MIGADACTDENWGRGVGCVSIADAGVCEPPGETGEPLSEHAAANTAIIAMPAREILRQLIRSVLLCFIYFLLLPGHTVTMFRGRIGAAG
jgi:hypothetical protein